MSLQQINPPGTSAHHSLVMTTISWNISRAITILYVTYTDDPLWDGMQCEVKEDRDLVITILECPAGLSRAYQFTPLMLSMCVSGWEHQQWEYWNRTSEALHQINFCLKFISYFGQNHLNLLGTSFLFLKCSFHLAKLASPSVWYLQPIFM